MSDFEKFKEKFPSKEKFYRLLTHKKKKIVMKIMSMLLKSGMHLKSKQ